MVLFHIVTTYHLLCALLYSRKEDEETVALCSKWLLEKFPNEKKFGKLFGKVIFADFNYRFSHSERATNHYFLKLIGNPKRYSKIFVWGAQFSFGFFLDSLQIPFYYCEEAAGMISRPDVLRSIEKKDKLKSKFWIQCDEYGAYDGTGKNVIKKICNVAAQEQGFKVDEKVVDFNVVSELKNLPFNERKQILDFFNPPRGLHVHENATLLLTQHLSNLGITSFEGQILLYQMAVDYFFEDDYLVIKPHPDDLIYYSQLFPGAQIIRERFPSEFLPFIFDNQLNSVATISSTAIYNLRGNYPKIFELDTRYEHDYIMTHRYYAAIRIAQELSLDMICYRSNELLAQRLSETLSGYAPRVSSIEPNCMHSMLLIDDVSVDGEAGRDKVLDLLEEMEESSCAVFINSKSDYCWYNYHKREIWQNMVPIVLTKVANGTQGEDFYASLNDEVIYVYAKNKELLKMAKETYINKCLSHTGITIASAKLDSQEEKIKMLEGILAATERRLLYYIEKEKESK